MQNALILGSGGAGLFFLWRERQKDQMKRYRVGGRIAWMFLVLDLVMNLLIGGFTAYLLWISFDTDILKAYAEYRIVASIIAGIAGPMVVPMLLELLIEEVEAKIKDRRKSR